MDQVDPNSTRRRGAWATLAIAAVTSAFAITFPAASSADPEPAPPPSPTNAAPPAAPPGDGNAAPPPAGPNAPPPPAVDPNAPPPPVVDPNAPPPPPIDPNAGRISNAVGGFSFVLPPGWVESDASHLDYGSELLSKSTGPAMPGQAPPVANDTRIVMGRLDQKLYASAEPNNAKAAVRLGSDMGEFFMPYPGTRINQEATPLTGANGIAGSASYYEVKFTDANKPNGQIWTGVVGSQANAANGPPQRWFVVWLGTGNDPVDKGAATALAESIQPANAPVAPAPPGTPPGPGAPGPAPAPPPPPGPAPAPAPGQAPAGEVTPTPTPTPQRVLPA